MADASAMEKIEKAKAGGIRFVQLQFTDILGIVKAVTIPIHRMEDSVSHGTWFDGSSIEGFTRIAESDQYLMPTWPPSPRSPGSPATARAAPRASSATSSRRAASPSPGTPATSSAGRSSAPGSSATS